MGSDDIRVELEEARRACAKAELALQEGSSDERTTRDLLKSVARLADAVESLLAERDAFTNRLRRGANRAAPPPGDRAGTGRQSGADAGA